MPISGVVHFFDRLDIIPVDWVWFDLVAASFFGFVQALVSKVDEPVDFIRFIRKNGNSLAHSRSRDFFVFGMTEDKFLHGFLNAPGNLMCFVPSGAGQRYGKFLAAPATDNITLFDVLLDGFA